MAGSEIAIDLVVDAFSWRYSLLEFGDLSPRQRSAARMSAVSSPMPSPRARLRHSGIAPSVRGKPGPEWRGRQVSVLDAAEGALQTRVAAVAACCSAHG